MRYLSASTAKWTDTASTETTSGDEQQLQERDAQKLEQILSDIMLSENLVVLAGLGTSMCATGSDKRRASPTMAEIWTAASQQEGIDFNKIKNDVRYTTPSGGENIELLLSRCQLAQMMEEKEPIKTFIDRTENLIVKMCSFVKDGIDLSTHSTFLRKVARRSPRKPRMKLFTTNYDLCFEAAATKARFVIVDGFSHSQPQYFDGTYFNYDLVRREQDREIPDYISNVFHLYKLHGSVDWEPKGNEIIKSANCPKPRIIYPRLSKFETSYSQPFLEMMSRFQTALREPNTGLIVCGFGFNDAHIAEPVAAAIDANVSLKVAVIDPAVEKSENDYVRSFRTLVERGDWRLNFVAAKFEEVVPILPDLVAPTELEQHQARMVARGGQK
jgi:hypothetical protein